MSLNFWTANIKHAAGAYAAVLLACLLWLCDGQAAGAENGGSDNIFTPPDKRLDAVPAFTRGSGRGGRLKAMLDDGIPGWFQIRQIPSLTPAQRREIHRLYQAQQGDIKSLGEQMRSLKAKGGADGKPADEIKARRLALWQEVRAMLSDEQQAEFQQMRRGQLIMPAAVDGSN